MSRPTETTQALLVDTLNQLLNEQGVGLLQDPLRLEGWLRDLFPDHRSAVSVVMEGLLTEICHAEGTVQDAAALLALRSGITPSWSDFSIRVWRSVFKGRTIHLLRLSDTITGENSAVQTVDELLSPYRKAKERTS